MEFPATKLAELSSIGVFHPSGLNDDRRVDLTDQVFTAVDLLHAEEIDDAIRTRYLRNGGFLVEVAFPDGSQVVNRPDIVESAVTHGESIYAPRLASSMLDASVVKQLELRNVQKRRAMVVSEEYDAEGRPLGNVEITPAFVKTECITPKELARRMFRSTSNAFLDFLLRRCALDGTPLPQPNQLPIGFEARKIGELVVKTHAIHANRSVANWTEEREVTLLNRTYALAKKGSAFSPLATFSTARMGHEGVIRGQQVTYPRYTSPLRRPDDLINHIQSGWFIATGETFYDVASMDDFAARLSDAQLLKSRKTQPIQIV